MTDLRVLFVAHAYPRLADDEAGASVHRLALGLRAAGCTIQVLAPAAPDHEPAPEVEGIPVTRFRYAPRGMESRAYAGTPIDQACSSLGGKLALTTLIAAGTLALSRQITAFAPDVIHSHRWLPSGILALGGAADLPVVTTVHGGDVRLARASRVAQDPFRRVVERSAIVTSGWEWLAAEARAIAPQGRFEVIPTAVDTRFATSEPRPRSATRFLYVGRLHEGCGVSETLEALSWTDPALSLDVVGEGPLAEALRSRSVDLGVASRVRWLGRVPRERLREMYASAQALIATGAGMGQALVAAEAQLSGLPVIGFRAGAMPEIVAVESGAGMLVTRGDVRALAGAMGITHAEPERLIAGGAAARARMLDRFAPAVIAARHLAVYRQALGIG